MKRLSTVRAVGDLPELLEALLRVRDSRAEPLALEDLLKLLVLLRLLDLPGIRRLIISDKAAEIVFLRGADEGEAMAAATAWAQATGDRVAVRRGTKTIAWVHPGERIDK